MVTIYEIDKIINIAEIKRAYFAGLFADYIYARRPIWKTL